METEGKLNFSFCLFSSIKLTGQSPVLSLSELNIPYRSRAWEQPML